ncbi:MAG: hypothetical protein HFJ06_09710 [Lachnospiraceae bacterium]|nr:hypothetical protein [Lachnospiraceae bacterium]
MINKKKTFIKWVFFFLLILMISGCQSDKETSLKNIEELKKITVTLKDKADITYTVTIDLKKQTKTLYKFTKNTEETTEIFPVSDDFLLFIKENLLTELTNSSKNNQSSDTLPVLWRIEIRTEEENYHINGYDEFPSYWETLLNYMDISLDSL